MTIPSEHRERYPSSGFPAFVWSRFDEVRKLWSNSPSPDESPPMTGLDLETFLQLLRADLGAWVSLGLVVMVLALMTWTSWGSRRALRKCLVLSIAAHVGLVFYGSTFPIVMTLLSDKATDVADSPPVRVQLASEGGNPPTEAGESKGPDGRPARAVAIWDRAGDSAGLANPSIRPILTDAIPDGRAKLVDPPQRLRETLAANAVVLEVNPPVPTVATNPSPAPSQIPTPSVAPGDPTEIVANVPKLVETTPADTLESASRLRPDRSGEAVAEPHDLARLNTPAPGLSATPLLEPPAATGLTPADATRSQPSKPATPDSAIALADPSEVAAPRLGPKSSEPTPASPALPLALNLRTHSRRSEATSPGVSPLAMLEPPRSLTPLALESTTLAPTPLGGQGPGLAATPREVPELAPPASVAADSNPSEPATPKRSATPAPRDGLPEANVRRQSRPGREIGELALAERRPDLSLPRVMPAGAPGLPAIAGATGLTRPPADVSPIYRSRLDPNRFALAQRAGASRESEQAVERALEWLRRHQDPDGRWDGGTAKYKDGTVAEGDDDYTAHCPPGDVCFGECYYWEADTALTGLALLSYLGAGYTHTDGQYAETVANGLEYLRLAQKSDGDLRGRSQAVGMYCHAMATLALCEAYALTGDPKLRKPVEKAVAFLVKSRARDRMAWRYAPGAPSGDTSILGWVVMVLKSAQENGIPIQANTKQGVLAWLDKVSSGPANGLSRYQPGEKVTPTMTAEAWVCRQFLSVGGPGATSNEAADYLLRNGPERSQYNLYYWYYGTLAMYQHGGNAWAQWNSQVRDRIINRQRLKGHASGSWDPDESQYGTHGGRIYCTALATLSLEVYYRYLRLYETPATTSTARSNNASPRRSVEIISEPVPAR